MEIMFPPGCKKKETEKPKLIIVVYINFITYYIGTQVVYRDYMTNNVKSGLNAS